jgi:uncharacterized FlaG/YvyC family protein
MEISKIIKTSLPQPKPKAAAPKPKETASSSGSDGADASARSTAPSTQVSPNQVQKAAKELEVRFNLKVEMATDETTGREVVRIFSEDGERLLRQMPPEQVIQMADQARQGNLESILNSTV